jgi:hypothetical protein
MYYPNALFSQLTNESLGLKRLPALELLGYNWPLMFGKRLAQLSWLIRHQKRFPKICLAFKTPFARGLPLMLSS